MNTRETELTEAEREKLSFIVNEIAHRLPPAERAVLAGAIERFARMVASRVYLFAENEGAKQLFRQRDDDSEDAAAQD